MERPEPRVLWYWHLANLWWSAVLMGLTGTVVIPMVLADADDLGLVVLAAWVALAVLLGVASLIAPWVRYRTFRFLLTERLVWVRDGVIVRREKVIPASRLQHVDVSSGPIERLFRLSSLTVFTAGGAVATCRISGLDPGRAEALRSRVLEVAEARRRTPVEVPSETPPSEQPANDVEPE
jgi:uncharacterized protein